MKRRCFNLKRRIYTDEEIKILKSNMFVRDVKYKREISYDPLFKLWTIMMKNENPHLSAKEIFSLGGFDVGILHSDLPRKRIHAWVENYKKFGINYFIPEQKSYSTIRKVIEVNSRETDSMKLQLMDFVLRKLKEYYKNDNR